MIDCLQDRERSTNARRLDAELARLRHQPSTTKYAVTQKSTWQLQEAFTHVEEADAAGTWVQQRALLADLAEAESANSARVVNSLLGEADVEAESRDLTETSLTDELTSISTDLHQRWQGALFALSPRNPDAARHFCASSREVLVQMLDLKAADSYVMAAMPACQRTDAGNPTRRAKIMYLLDQSGASEESLGTFIERDINDVLGLFSVFNSGTHGAAGKFDSSQLAALKERVEGAIRSLFAVVS